jgi:hypothetical protein
MSANGIQVNDPFGPPASEAASPAAQAGPAARVLQALRQGNLLLVALVLAGLAGVYLLSLRSGPATASAQQVQDEMRVDAALTNLRHPPEGGLAAQKSRTIIDMFYHETRQKQVPVSQLVANPFVFKIPGAGVAMLVSQEPDQAVKTDVDMSGPAALAAVRQLKLQSVLMGSRPSESLAMVSNNLLAVGQEVGGWTVRKIEPSRVTLTWREQEYVLEMPR